MPASHSRDLPQCLEQLNRIGIALSRERDTPKLMEVLLETAISLISVDGGTLYRLDEDTCELHFVVLQNRSLQLRMGGASGNAIPFPPIPLYDAAGQPNTSMVVTYAVLHDTTVVIDDAYSESHFDFSGTRRFDQRTGYHSHAFLTVPMKDHTGRIIGVFQLINALDPDSGQLRHFSAADRQLAESLASQAAIALTNQRLILQLQQFFEGLIEMINIAIDHKSAHTGGHCQRVPALTMMIAEAARNCAHGPLAQFQPSDAELYEIKIAGLLHDCGKIVTPVHLVDKSTKLETLFDRIHLLDTRFEVLKRDAEIAWLRETLAASARGDHAALPVLEQRYRDTLATLDEEREHLRHCNIGGETLDSAAQQRIMQIARRRWTGPDGQERDLLDADEIANLCIERGTLNPEERRIIEEHVVLTLRLLNSLPWPRNLRNVPEYAACHHEKLDGSGYHRGLDASNLPLPARIIGLADIFEALTARDRPYKPGKPLSEVLQILGRMAEKRHIDPDLFDLFVRNGLWLDYARQYLPPEQIDTVDLSRIPGYTP
ncbi:MAG: GAF domain-containing protein [Candidatus Competibacteraceae bacterium]|nr:MAG: GAF domain-containing protein [Candidatus Competibacteraceae bacterium]